MGHKQILIVDDEPVLAMGLVEALEQLHQPYQASAVYSGEQALERLHHSTPDLVVTDLGLPGINGLELVRWVRAFYPHMPTILITAEANDALEREARACGAWGFMAKPFDLQRFVEAVGHVLHAPPTGRVAVEQRQAPIQG